MDDPLRVRAPREQVERLVAELYARVPIVYFVHAMAMAGLNLEVGETGETSLVPSPPVESAQERCA